MTGHMRAITNQNGRFKGVIAHDGGVDDKGVEKPHMGHMHWVEKEKFSKTNK